MNATVVAVNISAVKGTPKTPVEAIEVRCNHGAVGDAHAGPGIRQISLLGIESIENFKRFKQGAEGLCEGKFAENITTRGIVLWKLPVGTRMRVGTALLEISQIGKKCHADQGCEIAKKYGICAMPKEGIFAVVIEDGVIRAGDEIRLLS